MEMSHFLRTSARCIFSLWRFSLGNGVECSEILHMAFMTSCFWCRISGIRHPALLKTGVDGVARYLHNNVMHDFFSLLFQISSGTKLKPLGIKRGSIKTLRYYQVRHHHFFLWIQKWRQKIRPHFQAFKWQHKEKQNSANPIRQQIWNGTLNLPPRLWQKNSGALIWTSISRITTFFLQI